MSFLGEAKRRKVFQVAAVYAVVAWLLVQIVTAIEAPLNLPEWVDTLVIVLLALGFPITLIMSWAFNLTADGVVRETGEPVKATARGLRIEYVFISVLVAAVAFLFVDNYLLGGDESAVQAVVSEPAAPATTPTQEPEGNAGEPIARRILPNSVAVLPFSNLSPDEDNAFFALGLHDEVLNQLAKLSNLSVISRTSMMRYAGSGLSVPEIARELNVETVMEGTVRYAGNRIRVTMQLIDAASDQHLWSETYERPFEDVFAVESDIAMNVANALNAEFSVVEQAAIEQIPTSSAAAYSLYLQARATLSTGAAFRTARALLDRALELDPEFTGALGYKAWIASSAFVNTAQGTGVTAEGREALEAEVRLLAARTLEMDPANFEARSALRAINIPTWRWSEFEAAVEPQDESRLLAQQQWIYAWMGRREDAVRIGEKAVALDPNELGPYLSLGVSQAYTGDIETANGTLRRGAELAPALPLIHVWIAYNHIALGNDDEALGELRIAEQLLGNNRQIVYLPELAYSYSRIGRSDDVARVVAEMQAIEDSNALGAGAWAMAYLAIGDEASALEQLEIVAEKARNHEPDQGYLNAMNLRMNFLNDARLEQPEFVDVLGRLHGD